MCQISVVVEKDGREELVMEDVTTLVVNSDKLQISNLFDRFCCRESNAAEDRLTEKHLSHQVKLQHHLRWKPFSKAGEHRWIQ